MSEQRFSTSPTPHVTVESCGGDLSIAGGAATEVVFQYDGEGNVQREGETLRARMGGDCAITCPPDSSITVNFVGGDFTAADLSGTLAVSDIGSDASVRGAGVVTVDSVGSDLSVRDVTGDLRVDNVGSDLEVRRVDGQLVVHNVGGELSAKAVEGNIEVQNVGGDASIETDAGPGKTIRVSAGGDVSVRLAPGASARFSLSAGGEIDNRFGFTEWSGDEHKGRGTIGAGEGEIELSAGGDLVLLPAREPLFNFDAIDSQIDAKMSAMEREIEAKMSELNEQIARMTANIDIESRLRNLSGQGRRVAEREVERARRHAERVRAQMERAKRQAERTAERARRQAEREAERARRNMERQAKHADHMGHPARHGFNVNLDLGSLGSWGKTWNVPKKPAKPQATEEERLMILRMLQEKKITADEAARLLEALEG